MNNTRKNHNVLVTSISKKVPLLKQVHAALHRLNPSAKLYGADLDKNVVGTYFVDQFWQMPRIQELEIQDLIKYCEDHQISFVIPTRDGELSYFSLNQERLLEQGIHVMVSPNESVSICLDKLVFYQTLNQLHYPAIPTFCSIEELPQPIRMVVKERFGAGAKSIGMNLSYYDALKHAATLTDPIFQPYIEGIEVSADLYIDRKGCVKGVICRTRDKVENGESQITSTKKIPRLEDLCANLAQDLNLYGHVIFQLRIDKHGKYHIIECNSRFGGASTLSVAAGLDSFYWFFLESMGENLDQYPFQRSTKELTLVRYPQDYIF